MVTQKSGKKTAAKGGKKIANGTRRQPAKRTVDEGPFMTEQAIDCHPRPVKERKERRKTTGRARVTVEVQLASLQNSLATAVTVMRNG
jgi:hypothetical protein